MDALHKEFLAEVEGFLAQTGTDASSFGRNAIRDPRFVFDLRKGRSPTSKTISRVREFIRASHDERAA